MKTLTEKSTMGCFTMTNLRAEVIAATAKYVPHMCWSNAVEALLTSGHPALEGAVYVEGWAVPAGRGIVAEHGWLKLTSGDILDLTWDHPARYFAGVEYSREELARLDPDYLPIVHTAYGRKGLDNPAYEKSYYDAVKSARKK